MLERKFEFVVHQSLKACEKRILNMEKPGCFPPPLYTISSKVLSTRQEGYSEIHLEQLFTGKTKVCLMATVEQVGTRESSISGTAVPKGIEIGLSVFVALGCLLAVMLLVIGGWAAWQEAGLMAAFFLVISAIQIVQVLHDRNRLIRELEKALNQPKKKKA